MHIAMLNVVNDKAPVSGYAMYIVCDETDRTIRILHPVTLVAVDLTHSEYRRAGEQELWPSPYDGIPRHSKAGIHPVSGVHVPSLPINEQVAQMIERKAKDGRPFSAMLIRRVLAALREIPLDEVKPMKDNSTSAPRGFAIKTEKRPGVIDAILGIFENANGASVEEALVELQKIFPDRPADGMKTTIRCQINRLPGKIGRKLEQRFEAERGRVYQWAPQ